MAEIGTDINKAKEILEKGGLVAIPTETVYGLAANAFNNHAVARIFEAKNRPSFDPLIVHIPDVDSLNQVSREVPANSQVLIDKFWPGPLSIILPKANQISDLVTSGLDTVAIRMPKHKMTRKLLQSLSFPLVAPSANPFGYVSPTSAKHVNDQLADKVDYILDGGSCKIGLESTIIEFNESSFPKVLRLGGLEIEEIEKVIGKIDVANHSSSNPKAPGMLANHYSPSKPIILGNIDKLVKKHIGKRYGVLSYTKKYDGSCNFVLSQCGSVIEAATNLFKGLRYMDKLDIDIILTEKVPAEGVGKAINDRLMRASVH